MNEINIKNKSKMYLSAWCNKLYQNTKTTIINDHVKHCLRIAEIMHKTGSNCIVNYNSRKILSGNIQLNELQLAAADFITQNEDFVKDHATNLINRWTCNIEYSF
jgi:hypothetical protein